MRDVDPFIPPYLLEKLAAQPAPELNQGATQTLLLDTQNRTQGIPADATAARRTPAAAPMPARAIHNAHNGTALPGALVRSEGEPASQDAATDEAYDYLGATWQMFYDAYGRNSVDDAGMPLVGSVHYGQGYDNAFWDGRQMVFGDGDGRIFNRFTAAQDVIGHELTHGVIDNEGGLTYLGQSGALNESLSDVFGSLVKQYHLRQKAEQADWLLGVGLFLPGIHARGLRSMAAPGTAYDDPVLGKDPQPDHMQDYVDTLEDRGGVHINSGIPNRAFYLSAIALGGYAWESAGRVWYDTLKSEKCTPNIDFAGFARLSTEIAAEQGTSMASVVRAAWRTVGVLDG